jgi:PadR family transcriptional regulator, regulatory protein PadR
MDNLTKQEELYLLAILRLQNNAYGVTIREVIFKITGKLVSNGALYFTLNQIYRKGYVTKTIGEPTPVRGGVRKKYYNLTYIGRQVLLLAYKTHASIWNGVSINRLG